MHSFLLAFFAVSVFGWGAFAQQTAAPATCLDAARVQTVLQQYAFKSWNPRIPPKGGWQPVTAIDLCNEQDLAHQIVQSLFFLEDFPSFDFPQDEFDQHVIGDSVIGFFSSRIHTIEFEAVGDRAGCNQGTVAFVSGSSSEPNTMHVCPYATNFSSLLLSSMLMHESRHIDGFPHSICESGLYVGSFACDPSYATGGSYAVGTELFVKTSRAFASNSALHDEARAEAISDLLVRFNEAPLGITEGALLLSQNGDLSFFDGGTQVTPILSGIPSTTKVVARDIIALFDTLAGTVSGYSGVPELTEMKGPFAQEYRQMDPSRQRQLLDVEYSDLDCFLFTDSIRCERGPSNVADIRLPEGVKPIQFLPLNGPAMGIYYIVAENGETYGLPSSEDLGTWKTEQIWRSDLKNLNTFKALVMFKRTLRFGVDRDGNVLYVPSPPGSQWTPYPFFQGQKFQNMLAPFSWSSQVIEL